MRILAAFSIMIALLLAPLGMIGGAAMAHEGPAMAATADCHGDAADGADSRRDLPGMTSHCALSCAMIPAFAPVLMPVAAMVNAVPVAARIVESPGFATGHEPPPPR